MSTDKDSDSRLGHDPLEWLEDDENELTADPKQESISPAESEKIEAEPETPAIEESTAQAEETIGQKAVESSATDGSSETTASPVLAEGILKLPEKVTVQVVESLHQEWQAILLGKPEHLFLDAENLMDADAAGIQLLFAFVHQLEYQGCRVELHSVSEHVQKLFGFAGMTDFFEKAINAA